MTPAQAYATTRPEAQSPSTLADVLRHHASQTPDKEAYLFLENGEQEGRRVSFAGLEHRSRAIATRLHRELAVGSRVLLLCPSGLEFIEAFLGCLYAGMVAVPAYPPESARVSRLLPRLQAILQDADPAAILTTRESSLTMEPLLDQARELRAPRWLTLEDEADPDEWSPPSLSGDMLAFLQYTSGSTTAPKGVMVSHRNLLHTIEDIAVGLGRSPGPDDVMVTWLPAFHDLGLLFGLLLPMCRGFRCVMMSPGSFLQRPMRWLEAISRYQGTHTAAPNFAYELCIRKSTPEQRRLLDLRSWRVAINAAEPIRHTTEQRFMEAFAPGGFRPEVLCHAYGLAEFTVKISSQLEAEPPSFLCVDRAESEAHRVRLVDEGAPGSRWIAGCGRPALDSRIEIVHPERHTRCLPGEVGEIWASGTSRAQGYWNRPQESAATFEATLADTDEGPFLRTGDLGFLKNGEVFVTGRMKDLIIVRGCNHYPQDLEEAAEASHPALRSGCSAAFSAGKEGEERIVLLAEVQSRLPPSACEEIAEAIRRTVLEQQDVHVHEVVLLEARTISKTSSGKIQRHACKADYLGGRLRIVAARTFSKADRRQTASDGNSTSSSAQGRDKQAIISWIASHLSRRLESPQHEVDTKQSLTDYGLDSEESLEFAADLGEWLGRKLPANIAYTHPSIDALASHLAETGGSS
jgi:acyl-CoA synthetase (AMP-forming)/AMP-acid ligase II/acyl carrier protein